MNSICYYKYEDATKNVPFTFFLIKFTATRSNVNMVLLKKEITNLAKIKERNYFT